MSYAFAILVHLLGAIIFLGFVFADIFVLPVMKRVISEDEFNSLMSTVGSRARRIFPLTVLFIVLSGGFMFTEYINSQLGMFNSNLQILLLIKVFLALLIVCGISYSLSMRALGKKPHAIMKYFHQFVLVAGFIIVVLAKLMFLV